jgi:hypothetical protein
MAAYDHALSMEVFSAFEREIRTPEGIHFMRDFFKKITVDQKIDLDLWIDVLAGRIDWLEECIHLILLYCEKHSVVFEGERLYRDIAFNRIFQSIKSCVYYGTADFIQRVLAHEGVMAIIKNTPLHIPDRFLALITLLKKQGKSDVFDPIIRHLWLDPDFFHSDALNSAHADLITLHFKRDKELHNWWKSNAGKIFATIKDKGEKARIYRLLIQLNINHSGEGDYLSLASGLRDFPSLDGVLTPVIASVLYPKRGPSSSESSETETPLGHE